MADNKPISQTNEYKTETAKRLYDKFIVYVSKGRHTELKAKAKEKGMSLNSYVNAALEAFDK